MKHYERFLWCLLVFLGILFSCSRAPQLITEETFTLVSEKGRDSTVQIRLVRAGSGELTGIGSGFFVARDKIATNLHNVGGKDTVFAKLIDKETMWNIEGVTAFDFENDLVILKVEGKGKPLLLGDSDAVQLGEPVVALGFPEAQYKVTQGTIHGIGYDRKSFRVKSEYVGGMSGAPVLNSKSEVIGVATMGSGAYGYVVASNTLKVLLSQSNSTESLTLFRKRDFMRALTYYSSGQKKFIRGDYAAAIDTFDKVINLNPEFVDAYGMRGLQKVHLGQAEAAKGNMEEGQGYYNEAIADFNEVFKLYPNGSPEGYRVLGYTKVKLGESKAFQGNTAQAQWRYHAAIEDFSSALKLNPEYASAYSNRGYAKTKLGESEVVQGNVPQAQMHYYAAIDDYTEAIRLTPVEYAETSLTRVYAKRLFEPEKADSYNKRGDVKFKLGESEAAQGNTEQAESYYRAAVADYTRAIDLWPDHAIIYRVSIEDYTRAIDLWPDHAVIYYNRGLAKRALGLQEEAQADFQKAAELNREIGSSRDN